MEQESELKLKKELNLMNSILPCPFCGGDVWFHEEHPSSDYVYVNCRTCPAEMLVSSLELAVKLWNTRVNDK